MLDFSNDKYLSFYLFYFRDEAIHSAAYVITLFHQSIVGDGNVPIANNKGGEEDWKYADVCRCGKLFFFFKCICISFMRKEIHSMHLSDTHNVFCGEKH